ncbi:MAG TPA: PEP-CTERM sorting domain-containing protein [Vicinamibacterales bacterium]|nr:PEP-CTERM sorting domain-containing protein [Vicinamibacterales bacterium]
MNRVIGHLAVIFVLTSSSSALAGPILDQFFVPISATTDDPLDGSFGDCCRAQTFTAGITGLLTRVDLLLRRSGEIEVGIYDTLAGAPGAPLQVLPSQFVNGPADLQHVFVSFIGFSVPVIAGHVYAIVGLGRPDPGVVFWGGAFGAGATYAGGERFFDFGGLGQGPWIGGGGADDNGFRTFVDSSVQPIPEPTSILLLVTAMVLCRLGRRPRRLTT